MLFSGADRAACCADKARFGSVVGETESPGSGPACGNRVRKEIKQEQIPPALPASRTYAKAVPALRSGDAPEIREAGSMANAGWLLV